MRPAVELEDLCFSYGSSDVLQSITLQLHFGQIYALLGPNGAGKSTLQRLLLGSWPPRSGQIKVFGNSPFGSQGQWRSRVAWVTDVPAVHARLTVEETLKFYAGLYGIGQPRIRIAEVLQQVGLESLRRRPAQQLSRGQQQRLAWAKAMLLQAELWLLDEPTSGLDIGAKQDIHHLILGLKQSGRCVLLTTHDMREAQELADQVGILHQGQLLLEGSPAQLCSKVLGQELQQTDLQPSLERVYREVTGRSLFGPTECPGQE